MVAEIKTEALAQGFQLLQGNCFPTDRSFPYAPLLDLLRSVFLTSSPAQVEALVGPFAREFAPLLSDVIHLFTDLTVLPPLPSLDPEQEKRRLFAALEHFFLSQAAEQPLLLVVEDLHWSDDTSLSTMLLCGDTYFSTTLVTVTTSVTEVLREGERALKIAREIGQRSGEAYICSCMAICLGSRGEYTHALELAHDGLRIAEEIEHRHRSREPVSDTAA